MLATHICRSFFLGLFLTGVAARVGAVDLLERYPTRMTVGDTAPERARPWEFTAADVYQISGFTFQAGKDLRVEVGPAALGIGHCADGAVWAVLLPREGGKLTSLATNHEETISHVWLRFHPKEVSHLFPPETVSTGGASNLMAQVLAVARHKFTASWHVGNNAMIPAPKDVTVDVDTKDGLRRFFAVDNQEHTAQYMAAFEQRRLKPPPPFSNDLAAAAFDQLWEAFDRKYAMFVLRPEVDWAKLREQYRPKALACGATYEFADVCADLLKPLRDLHVWLKVADADVPVFNRPRTANANPSAHRAILGQLNDAGRNVKWAVTSDKIGFIAIYGWNGQDLKVRLGEVLEQMRDTRGLIVDVRLNGGGSEDLAREFAGRFLKQEFVYAYNQLRNGSSHTNLTKKFERKLKPRGPWRYDRPVLLLIGQKCMSSNESFIGMMTGNPDATTMGDHTCGSSGNPEMVELPLEMTVSVPRWIDYLPDGSLLDERGFQPQVPFPATPGAFDGDRDDLLTAALARLRQAALPRKPIEGAAFLSEEKAEAEDATRPKVVSVVPPDGAKAVQPFTELRVRFDRPMDPLSLKLDWKSGGFVECEFPQYDPQKYEFAIPVRLASATVQQIVVNQPLLKDNPSELRKSFPRDGFQSVDHRLARLFAWQFQTAGAAPSAHAAPPKALKLSPPAGSQVPYRTFLEVQFDQAMKPPSEAPPFLDVRSPSTEPALIPLVEYDSSTHTFRIPLLLPPKQKALLSLAGFSSAAGVPSEPLKLEYQVSEEDLSKSERERFDAGKSDPRLLETLESMRQKRAQMTSLAERVQSLVLSRRKGLFVSLSGQSASFKWQKPDRFYADATDMMLSCSAFVIGCDGQNWWWHSASERKTELVACPLKEMHERNLCICDPFELTCTVPKQAAAELNLKFVGQVKLGDTDCLLLERWNIDPDPPEFIPLGNLTRWWIDPQTGRPLEMGVLGGSYLMRTRFFYDKLNQSLAAEDFAMPKVSTLSPAAPAPLDADYTNRFVNLRDGSDGRMSVRWGKLGPKGRSSDGLN